MPPAKRAPFTDQLPKPEKRSAGRTPASATPLHVRTFGVPISEELADDVRRKLGARLGKFAPRIERISVRFTDTNGPKGGVDTLCQIKATLSGLPSVVVAEQATDAVRAFEAAIDVVGRAVQDALEKATDEQRRKPSH